jgi:hypothetical protein
LQLCILGQVAVFGAAPFHRALQVGRQRFPCGMLVGEQRVAPLGRQLLRVQHRAQARYRLV